jgi:succinoglycan biosynthesis transport protein ExoP
MRGRLRLILAVTISCVVGAYIATLVIPARWEGDSRVILNFMEPDPVTGEVIAANGTNTYVASQVALATDYSVASQVVDELHWASDPILIADYNDRWSDDPRDFRHWAAQFIIDRTKAQVEQGSNILDISFIGATPDQAKAVADALRQSYIDLSLSLRRADTLRSAEWFDSQAVKEKQRLDSAEAAEADYSRVNNVYMATDTNDVDSSRLAALAAQSGGEGAVGGTSASVELAEVNADISALTKILGPNHPELQALRAKRAALAAVVGETPASDHTGAKNALEVQAAIVNAKSGKLARLRELRAEVEVRRQLYDKTVARAAELRQEAAIVDPDLTPLGAATVPASPSFPYMPLVMGGSLALGLVLGTLIALLAELLNRRVRSPEDLQVALDLPVLAVVMAPQRRL